MVGCSDTVSQILDTPSPPPLFINVPGQHSQVIRRCPGERRRYRITPGVDRHCSAGAVQDGGGPPRARLTTRTVHHDFMAVRTGIRTGLHRSKQVNQRASTLKRQDSNFWLSHLQLVGYHLITQFIKQVVVTENSAVLSGLLQFPG